MGDPPVTARRRFLQGAGGVLLLKPRTVLGSEANSTVEVGLVGCGSRGNWIAPLFSQRTNARVVALADVIRSRLDSTRARLEVDSSRAYWGPEACRELANRNSMPS